MSTDDFALPNARYKAFRLDTHTAVQALATNSSSDTAPTVTLPNQWWADTTSNMLKMRNAANTEWDIIVPLDGSHAANTIQGRLTSDGPAQDLTVAQVQALIGTGADGTGGSGWTVAASAPDSPADGDGWYDTVNNLLKIYDGSTWETAGITGATGATGPAGVAGPTGIGLPVGGDATQVLTKTTGVNYSVEWADLAAGDGWAVTGTAPASPAGGDGWYDTVTSTLKIWNGSAWIAGSASGSSNVSNVVTTYSTQSDKDLTVIGSTTWIDLHEYKSADDGANNIARPALETAPFQCRSLSEVWELMTGGTIYFGAGSSEAVGYELKFQYSTSSTETGTYSNWADVNPNTGGTNVASKDTFDAGRTGNHDDGTQYRDYTPFIHIPITVSTSMTTVTAGDWVKLKVQMRLPDTDYQDILDRYRWHIQVKAIQIITVGGSDGATGATGAAGAVGQGVPTGGTSNQVLAKVNATDYNTTWVTASGGESGGGGAGTGTGWDTQTAAPTDPTDGDGWYDTANDVLNIYDGTSWNAPSHDIPSGGVTDQIVSKVDGSDYNVQWVTPTVGSQVSGTFNETTIVMVTQTDQDTNVIDDNTWTDLYQTGTTPLSPAPVKCLATDEIWSFMIAGVLYCSNGTMDSIGVEMKFQYSYSSTETGTYSSWADVTPGTIDNNTSFRSKLASGRMTGAQIVGGVVGVLRDHGANDGTQYRDYMPFIEAPITVSSAMASVSVGHWVKLKVLIRIPDTDFSDVTSRYGWTFKVEAHQSRTFTSKLDDATTTTKGVMQLSTATENGTGTATDKIPSVASTKSIAAGIFANPTYESAEIAITATVNYSATHGLNRVPVMWDVILVCKATHLGYAVGDEVSIKSMAQVGTYYTSAYANSSTLNYANLFTAGLGMITATGGLGSIDSASRSKWKMIFRAW